MPKANNGYVVYFCERLRDGMEESAKCFDTLDQVLAFVNKDFFAKDNYEFCVFALGEEVPLKKQRVEVPQPPKVTEHFVLAVPLGGRDRRPDEPTGGRPSRGRR